MQRCAVYAVIETEVSESPPRATMFAAEAAAEAYAIRLVRRHLKTTEADPETLCEKLRDTRSGYAVHVVPAPFLY
ncbi:MAG TPA: hypothetical protein VM221_13130 [Armatimonadota bacterium]|nr:hypothetical protein [Armatimonadota bacterium]